MIPAASRCGSLPPSRLFCKFCHQAARVLWENIRCTACGQSAGNPDQDTIVVVKVTD